MSVPEHPPKDAEDEEKVELRKVSLEVESSCVMLGAGHFLYTYSWRDAAASEKPAFPIWINWPEDSFVVRAVRESRESEDKLLSLTGVPRGVYRENGSPPAQSLFQLKLIGPNNKKVGSMQVSVYRPANGGDR